MKISERNCVQCSKLFTPRSHGGTKQFCSYTCSNTYKWKNRERRLPKIIKCKQCGRDFTVRKRPISHRFCSPSCAGDARRIRDGLNKGQRHYRKKHKNVVKRYSPDWIEKIRATTKEAMSRPDIKEKLKNPKGPMSIEARIKHSNALAGKLPKNMMFGSNGSYPNVQRGDYENSKGTMYFRSKWEANYALFLDFLVSKEEIKSWEYEPDVFIFENIKFGTRSYRPDFKVFNHDDTFEYHEVKGYMDSKSKTKLKRMKKYYPEVKIILIDQEYYRDLKKKIGKSIGFY